MNTQNIAPLYTMTGNALLIEAIVKIADASKALDTFANLPDEEKNRATASADICDELHKYISYFDDIEIALREALGVAMTITPTDRA